MRDFFLFAMWGMGALILQAGISVAQKGFPECFRDHEQPSFVSLLAWPILVPITLVTLPGTESCIDKTHKARQSGK